MKNPLTVNELKLTIDKMLSEYKALCFMAVSKNTTVTPTDLDQYKSFILSKVGEIERLAKQEQFDLDYPNH